VPRSVGILKVRYRDPIPIVAGIDSSTQSTKVELRDTDTGRVAGFGRAPHPPTTSPRSEQNPWAWWAALKDAMAMAFASSDAPLARDDVVALSVAAQQHGLVVLDKNQSPLRDAKLWNDTESADDALQLVQQLSAEAWAQSCGSVPVAAFTITKLAWLKRREPQIFAEINHVLLPHDWLNFQLTGRLVTDRGDASGTGYWSPLRGEYQRDLLAMVDPTLEWDHLLPDVLGPCDQAGELTTVAAEHLGLRRGTPVAVGTGDNMAGALGLGLGPGDVAVSIGTSGTVFSTCRSSVSDPSGLVAGFADATGNYLPLVCTLNATQVTDAVARLLAVEREEFEHLALASTHGSGSLTLVPYFGGERTPNRPEATGTLYGMTLASSREMIARAAFEGVVCGLLDGLDALSSVGVPTTSGKFLLIGGGAKSAAYRQVLASLAMREVTVPMNDEIVATGAAVQAAILATSCKVDEITDRWGLRTGTVVEPSSSAEDALRVRQRYIQARA